MLAVLAERGAAAVVMEVSSHALALGRVDGIAFDVVAFTNFGRDHLDFHGDLETYFEAKAALFTAERARRAVINVDDPRGRELAERVRRAGRTRGEQRQPARRGGRLRRDVDVAPRRRPLGGDRSRAGARTWSSPSPCRGTSTSATPSPPWPWPTWPASTWSGRRPVWPLRVCPVGCSGWRLSPPGPAVFVDFAHTPQAVTAVLGALAGSRRVVVLGCGGNRDPDKREPMGAAAVAGAEVVVVTDDNPRLRGSGRDPGRGAGGAHAEQLRQRHRFGREVAVVDGGDRRSAIELGLTRTGRADVLAMLGKGHESGQEIAGRVISVRRRRGASRGLGRAVAPLASGAP